MADYIEAVRDYEAQISDLDREIEQLKGELAEKDRCHEQQTAEIKELRQMLSAGNLQLGEQRALLKETGETCRFIEKNAEIGKDYPKTPGGLASLSIYDAVAPLLAKLRDL